MHRHVFRGAACDATEIPLRTAGLDLKDPIAARAEETRPAAGSIRIISHAFLSDISNGVYVVQHACYLTKGLDIPQVLFPVNSESPIEGEHGTAAINRHTLGKGSSRLPPPTPLSLVIDYSIYTIL